VKPDEKKPNHLIVAMTSDRGLCGSAHSTICRTIRNDLPLKAQGANVKIIAVGEKSKAILSR
jgi:F0F1-type ATP synthase gamma subunit